MDLVQYLVEDPSACNQVQQSKCTLELGCGHGLPGITALKLGCQKVFFSDLNEEVLQETTWPNITLNCPNLAPNSSVCVSGDWNSMMPVISEYEKTTVIFDLILSAETIYTVENCISIINLLKMHLNKEGGVAYFATKRYYFGLGGGTEQLQEHLTESTGLACIVVKSFEDGSSNIRDIIKIYWK
jgi:predicted nicotinamide N-methyase